MPPKISLNPQTQQMDSASKIISKSVIRHPNNNMSYIQIFWHLQIKWNQKITIYGSYKKKSFLCRKIIFLYFTKKVQQNSGWQTFFQRNWSWVILLLKFTLETNFFPNISRVAQPRWSKLNIFTAKLGWSCTNYQQLLSNIWQTVITHPRLDIWVPITYQIYKSVNSSTRFTQYYGIRIRIYVVINIDLFTKRKCLRR